MKTETKNIRDILLAQWNDAGQKVITLAEEFPEEKYDFKFVKGARTFGDVLRHVAFWTQYVAKTARGEKAEGDLNELPKSDYSTKAKVVEVLKRSLAESAAELKKQPPNITPDKAELFTAFTGHSGEHYGQLVVYYRLNGIVPPASRTGN